MKAVSQKKVEAVKKANIKQAQKGAAAKIKEATKKAEKKAAQATIKKAKKVKKVKKEAAGPVPVNTEGCNEVQLEVSWAERKNDKTIPAIRGTYERLPIKLGAEAGAVFWKLDKARLQNFIACEQDPKMVKRYKAINQEAKKLGLLC